MGVRIMKQLESDGRPASINHINAELIREASSRDYVACVRHSFVLMPL